MTSADFSVQSIKMEGAPARLARKRNFSQTSWSNASSPQPMTPGSASKKLKKYELDPSSDPTIKNAVAAKANREKKKAEEQALKIENESLKMNQMLLEKQLEESLKCQLELARMLEEERARNALNAAHQPYPAQTSQVFFQSVMDDITRDANALPAEDVSLDNINIDFGQFENFDETLLTDDANFFNPNSPSEEKIIYIEPTYDSNPQDPLLIQQYQHFGQKSRVGLQDTLNEQAQYL